MRSCAAGVCVRVSTSTYIEHIDTHICVAMMCTNVQCVQVATIAHLSRLDDPRPPRQGGLPHGSFKGGLFATDLEEGTIDFDAYRGSCVASTEEETSRRGGRKSQRQPAGR